ncbi:hypothetical protein KSF78_0004189 [Schistosoma japonicum]|nr:hypothetical protein KSF78_0004189 [Schistosoma japonicum]
MSVIFTTGKKSSEIIGHTSSTSPKVRRTNARITKNPSTGYEPSENVVVWNINLGEDQFNLAYCMDTQILWCNDEQVQLHTTSEKNSQEYLFSLKDHKGILTITSFTNQITPICKLYIDGNEIQNSRNELPISKKKLDNKYTQL